MLSPPVLGRTRAGLSILAALCRPINGCHQSAFSLSKKTVGGRFGPKREAYRAESCVVSREVGQRVTTAYFILLQKTKQ